MNPREIYIFGSIVRGEVDPGSDVDVLVIVEGRQRLRFPPHWSVYSRARLTSLYKRGTLFAWHLHKEAVPVFIPKDPGLLARLGQPSPYSGAFHEVCSLRRIMNDAVEELHSGTPSPTYELGLVGMACRDIAMAAIPALEGHFTFSKLSPLLLKKPTFPLSKEAYNMLCDCRRSSTRGRPARYQGIASRA